MIIPVRDHLSHLARIRRGDELPEQFAQELACRSKYPHEIALSALGGILELKYRRTRRRRIAEVGCVKRREVFGWIETNGERVGGVEFAEFTLDTLIDNEDVLETMDADSAADAALSVALCQQWRDLSSAVADYGPIIELETVWMTPSYAHNAVWSVAVEALIGEEFADYSILVLKAFPLEYQGAAPAASSASRALEERSAAMRRYYKRVLGVEEFSGENGQDGWLWRPNPSLEGIIHRGTRHAHAQGKRRRAPTK